VCRWASTGLWARAALAVSSLAWMCPVVPAAVAGTVSADQARAVLERHCARCHEAGKLENPPAKGALGNILDLDALTARDDLVAAGDPDASRLYQIMLSRHRPQSVFFGPVPGPTAAEVQAVRDWLAGLSARAQSGRAEDCADRGLLAPDDVRQSVAAWRKAFESDPAKPLRFVSLANLYNHCRGDGMLAAYRDAVTALLARLTGRAAPAVDTVGEASMVLAFRPDEIALTAEAWDLRAGRGGEIAGVVAAEELAARALAAGGPLASAGMAASLPIARAGAASLIGGVDAVEALASEFTRTVSLSRAAAELAVPVAALRERLASRTGDDATLALRLSETGLPRADWETLKAALDGRAALPASASASVPSPSLRLALWTDRLTYRAGDLLTVRARPTADCNLTIVAIEADGVATVLFPNDTVVDNRVAAGSVVQVPAPRAPFQLRLDNPGRQGIVGICNAQARRPEGIGHDFERQRFTVLGDWRTFLATTAEREAAYQKTQDELRRFRTGAGNAETLDQQLPVGTEDEARAGLSFDVMP
jgi:hypothetical protein